MYQALDHILGLSRQAHDLELPQMAARALVVFCFGVLLARVGDRRMLGHNSGFDIMLLVVLGSVLSRAINGTAAFFPTLGASVLLVALHDILARLTRRSHRLSKAVKGSPCVLIRDGEIDERQLRRNKITHDDLDENIRLHGNVREIAEVAEARLERDGTISVVKAKRAS